MRWKIDLYFHGCKLAIEVDEKGHKDRDIYHEIERIKGAEKGLDCNFVGINSYEDNFSIFKAIKRIHRHIKKSTKIFDRFLSKRLLELKFRENRSLKCKALKFMLKNTVHIMKHSN